MNYAEHPLMFPCQGDTLYGVLSMPEHPSSRAVLVVVGGPQYRAGSHRQFVLLAREFASHGYPVLRFDYRGMGDSEGELRNFEEVGEDLRAAIDALFDSSPLIRDVVIWGLCDGASAAAIYAHSDARVSGSVLVNPWTRTDEGEAKAQLKHYYRARLLDAGFWKKVAMGEFDFGSAARSLWTVVGRAYGGYGAANDTDASGSLPQRLYDGLNRFRGRIFVILSENDLTAQEFGDLGKQSGEWERLMSAPRLQCHTLASANHTFSRRAWRDEVAAMTLHWLSGNEAGAGSENHRSAEIAKSQA